jgi:hypothetical protein
VPKATIIHTIIFFMSANFYTAKVVGKDIYPNIYFENNKLLTFCLQIIKV